jgi:hypothetical protein
MSKRKTLILTFSGWLFGSGLYFYWWVASIINDPATVGYERWLIFPVSGFLVYRFPYLLIGLIIVIAVEAMLFDLVIDYYKVK